jgi:hypothetical protein
LNQFHIAGILFASPFAVARAMPSAVLRILSMISAAPPIWAIDSAPNQHSPDGLSHDFVRRCAQANALMAKQLELIGRRYWIISEPYVHGWRATVVELVDAARNTTEPVGIEATAQTRGAADEAAERKLLRLLHAR